MSEIGENDISIKELVAKFDICDPQEMASKEQRIDWDELKPDINALASNEYESLDRVIKYNRWKTFKQWIRNKIWKKEIYGINRH